MRRLIPPAAALPGLLCLFLIIAACTVDQLRLATSEISKGIQAACADAMAVSKLPNASPDVAVYATAACSNGTAVAALAQNSATLVWLGQLQAQLAAAPKT
jgi:hypothetical protein